MAKKEKEIVLTYAGKRLGKGNKMLDAFVRLPDTKEIYWSGIRGTAIGIDFKGVLRDGTEAISKKPEWIGRGDKVTQEMIDEWEAKDAATRGFISDMRAKAKIRSEKSILKDVQALKKYAKTLNFIEQRHLVSWLLEKFDEN